MTSLTPTKNFHNANGRIYAQIADGILRKSEKERDRLRIFGGRSHAIDEDLFDECCRLGVSELRIREKTDDGVFRVWKISLDDVRQYGKIRTLRGIERRTIPLVCCKLVSGPAEPWYAAERAALLEEAKPKAKEDLHEQSMLFPVEKRSAWQQRMKFDS